MKKNLLKHVVHMTGCFTLAFMAQCLSMSPLLAADGKLLVKSMDEVQAERAVDVIVSGTVTDVSGEPIPGVTVSVPGTTVGTATDLDGRYSLSVPEGSTLVFSFIGFETQSIAIGDRSVIDVTLSEDMASLDEVVVVGYGIQRKANLTGAVDQVTSEVFENRPISNI